MVRLASAARRSGMAGSVAVRLSRAVHGAAQLVRRDAHPATYLSSMRDRQGSRERRESGVDVAAWAFLLERADDPRSRGRQGVLRRARRLAVRRHADGGRHLLGLQGRRQPVGGILDMSRPRLRGHPAALVRLSRGRRRRRAGREGDRGRRRAAAPAVRRAGRRPHRDPQGPDRRRRWAGSRRRRRRSLRVRRLRSRLRRRAASISASVKPWSRSTSRVCWP